eukprot:6219129-Amphidinium_carterae.1
MFDGAPTADFLSATFSEPAELCNLVEDEDDICYLLQEYNYRGNDLDEISHKLWSWLAPHRAHKRRRMAGLQER